MEDNNNIDFDKYKNLLDVYKNNYNDEKKNEILKNNLDILVIANYFKNITESSQDVEPNKQIINQYSELINKLNETFSDILFKDSNNSIQFGGGFSDGFSDFFNNIYKKFNTVFIDKQDILNIINKMYENEANNNPLSNKNLRLENDDLTEFLNCFSFKNNKVDNQENDNSKYYILSVINNLNNKSENSIILENSKYNQYINKSDFQDNNDDNDDDDYDNDNNDKFKDLFTLYRYDIEFTYKESAFSYQNFKNRLLNGPKNLAEEINKTLNSIIYEYIEKRNAIFNINEFKIFFQNINDSKIDINNVISKDNKRIFKNYKNNEFQDKIVELFKVIQKNVVKDDQNIHILNTSYEEQLDTEETPQQKEEEREEAAPEEEVTPEEEVPPEEEVTPKEEVQPEEEVTPEEKVTLEEKLPESKEEAEKPPLETPVKETKEEEPAVPEPKVQETAPIVAPKEEVARKEEAQEQIKGPPKEGGKNSKKKHKKYIYKKTQKQRKKYKKK